MAQPQSLELPFPLQGVAGDAAYTRFPEAVSPDALNVMGYDALGNRLRGGQRPGLSKFLASAVNGTNQIQSLGLVTTAFSESIVADVALLEETWPAATYTAPNHIHVDNSSWREYDSLWGVRDDNGGYVLATDGVVTAADEKTTAVIDATNTAARLDLSVGSVYIIKATCNLPDPGAAATDESQFYLGCRIDTTSDSSPEVIRLRLRLDKDGTLDISLTKGGLSTYWTEDNVGGAGAYATTGTGNKVVELHVNGNSMQVFWDGSEVHSVTTVTDYSASKNTGVGFGFGSVNNGDATDVRCLDFSVYTGEPPNRYYETNLAVVSGGAFYGGTADGVSASTNATGNVSTQERVAFVGALQKGYFADGWANGYKIWTPNTNVITKWEATAGILPVGGGGTAYAIDTATPGTSTFTVSEDLTSLSDGDYISVTGSTGNDGTYRVASVNGTTNIVVDQTFTDDTADGNIVVADRGCRIAALYRGRIVMAGLATDPQNWFMSAVGDPLDWDYSPSTTSALMAVAGNNADAGKVGDPITCLAPFSDDVMLMGGDHTLWMMRGDPAARGMIDAISYKTGVAGPRAFAWDADGTLHFFGAGTHWAMAAGGSDPQPLSRGRMDREWNAIDLTTKDIQLVWDTVRRGLHIYVVPLTSEATTHWFWDARTDAYWPIQYPNDHGPTAILAYDADSPVDAAVLLGGFDSVVRTMDDDATSDDGTAISSYVVFSPINPGKTLRNVKLIRLTTLLDDNSDDVTVAVYSGDSPQTALDLGKLHFSRAVSAGRTVLSNRVLGNTVVVKLSNSVLDKRWAVEMIEAVVAPAGRTHQNSL